MAAFFSALEKQSNAVINECFIAFEYAEIAKKQLQIISKFQNASSKMYYPNAGVLSKMDILHKFRCWAIAQPCLNDNDICVLMYVAGDIRYEKTKSWQEKMEKEKETEKKNKMHKSAKVFVDKTFI